MRGLTLVLGSVVWGLVGCTAVPELPAPQGVFRAAKAPIASSTRFDPASMAGMWRVTAAFASAEGTLPAAQLEMRMSGSAILVTRGAWMMPKGTYEIAELPGRLMRQGGPEVWLLWVDDDWRTAVMGAPDGRVGWIMERGKASADRTRAAREILAWQGFDLTKLREVAQ